MKMIGLYIVLLVLFACSKDKGVRFQNKNLSDVISLAQNQNKMILIDFWSDG